MIRENHEISLHYPLINHHLPLMKKLLLNAVNKITILIHILCKHIFLFILLIDNSSS